MISDASYYPVGPGCVAWVPIGMIPLPIYADGVDGHTMYHQQTIYCKNARKDVDCELRLSLDGACSDTYKALKKKDGWEAAGLDYNKFMQPLRPKE